MNVPASTDHVDNVVDVPPSYSSLTPSNSGGISGLYVIPNYPPPSYDMAVKGKRGCDLSRLPPIDIDRMQAMELNEAGQLDRLLITASPYDRAASSQLYGVTFADDPQSNHPSFKHQMIWLFVILMFLVGSLALLAIKMKLRSEEIANQSVPGCNTKPYVCQNGGSCISTLPDAADNRTYRCLCRNSYFGAHCTLIDACKTMSWPCFNGGVCISGSDGSNKCNCSAPYAGLHCEIDTNPCRSQPCNNGGRCMYTQRQINVPGDLACVCLPAFTGKWCEKKRW